tara:strand:- start:515 stop:658 length:144 start_codon:yes stop_codon:yes gene_type:complete
MGSENDRQSGGFMPIICPLLRKMAAMLSRCPKAIPQTCELLFSYPDL